MNMTMGYYYESPKRGDGYSISTANGFGGRLYISPTTKASALEIKRQMIAQGIPKEEILIEKN
jgi:hypothetical protein